MRDLRNGGAAEAGAGASPARRRSQRLLLASAAVVLLAAPAAMAQAQLSEVAAANLARQTGLAATKSYLSRDEIKIPASSLDPLDRAETIEAGLREYEAIHNRFASAVKGTRNVQIGTGALVGGGVILSGGSIAPVAIALLGGASEAGLEILQNDIASRGRIAVDDYVAVFGEAVMSEAGIESLEAFDGRPEDLQALLRNGVAGNAELLEDLRRRAGEADADALVDLASEMIVRRMSALDDAALTAMTNTSVDLDEVDNRLTGLVGDLQEELDHTRVEMGRFEEVQFEVQADIQRLGNEIASVNESLDELGANQDLIADFVYSNMPAADKARMLRAGLADARIVCPRDNPACDKIATKYNLIERYETEARITRNVKTAETILRDVKSATRIADDLGIDISPDGKQAIEIASGAINAYMGFMTGNYLGAIQSVTGMFASPKPDPDAVRFQIMMKFLQEQFEVINEKLDNVLDNQQAIYDAVVAVSEQVQQSHEILFAKLDQIAWLQVQTDANVKRLLWREWRTCQTLYDYVMIPSGPRPRRVDPATLLFYDTDSLLATTRDRGQVAVECLNTFQLNNDSLSNVALFGNFLSDDFALAVPPVNTPADTTAAADNFRSQARRFQEQIDIPSWIIVENWMRARGFSHDDLLHLFAVELHGVDDVDRLYDRIKNEWSHECGAPEVEVETENVIEDSEPAESSAIEGSVIVDGLICGKARPSEEMAYDLMREGLATSTVLDLVPWVVVLSQVADWHTNVPPDGQVSFARSLEELVERPVSEQSRGQEIIRNMIDLTTLASAYENRVFGGLTARILADAVISGEATAAHVALLRDNEILARNTALILMHSALPELPMSGPGLERTFIQAVTTAREGGEHTLEPLTGLFGNTLTFSLDADGEHPRIVISAGGTTTLLPLPGPMQLAEGTFVLPPTHPALGSARERLVERLSDYELGSDPNLAAAILQPSSG